MRPSPSLGLLTLAALLFTPACRDRHRPWEQLPDAGPMSAPPSVPLPDASLLGDASSFAEGVDASATVDPDLMGPVRVGGPWVRCYGNYKLSGDPLTDVTRLGMLCGPENGMRRVSDPIQGAIEAGKTVHTSTFDVLSGECYRVFATAEATVTDLDVDVVTRHGARVASDHGEDGWSIVQPDRPFCPLSDDTYTLEVKARLGRGRFAAEIWRLRTPPARGGRQAAPKP
jgi:hypothetical protein